MISDHFHPWVRRQGQSPFVWTVLGAIANATDRLRIGTGVSAAVSRLSPVVLAHAAATTAALFEGRFFLGMGTGERLNEHITGERWPSTGERRAMLEEAVTVIKDLWSGREVNHRGEHFTVEHAQLFTRPATPPDLLVAAGSNRSAELAGRLADGMIAVTPDEHLVQVFEESGGHGKRKVGQVKVCYAASEDDAKATALEWWPNGVLQGGPNTELPRPRDFEAASAMATTDAIGDVIVCGPDPSGTSRRSVHSSPPATTRCTSTKWDPTRRRSSTSTAGDTAGDRECRPRRPLSRRDAHDRDHECRHVVADRCGPPTSTRAESASIPLGRRAQTLRNRERAPRQRT